MHYLAFNEKKQHGTAQFPVAYYYIHENHPEYTMPFHWHKEWEIIRVLDGTFLISVDGQEYTAKQGDILLLHGGTLHGGLPPYHCTFECLDFDLHGLFLDISQVKEYLRPFYRNTYLPLIFYPGYHADVYPIVEELMGGFAGREADPFRTLNAFGNVSRLFAILLKKGYYRLNTDAASDTAAKTTAKTELLKPVLEYMETNFASPLSLAELSGIIGMNPKYFCRFFKAMTNQTPMNYLNYYRVERAARMLGNPSLSVTEVGLECGFNDICHFIKTFKKYKNTTPKQYQKKNSAASS